jgi:signal transduction histidine kinase
LETAKEELQSSNEELQTLNEELKNRNQALGRLNDDLANLIENVDVTVVMVDNDLKIRRLTPSAQELLNILPSDVGRLITHIHLGLPVEDLDKVITKVINKLAAVEQEVEDDRGHCYEMRVRPYLTQDKKIDGAVLSFTEITTRKELENERKRHTEELETQVEQQAKKLLQSERLAAIGATAGMIGHDIRNPLQTVTGEVYMAKGELKNLPDGAAKESIKESLETIGEQTVYVNKIVADLQDYARPLTPKVEEVDFTKIVKVALSSSNVPENVAVKQFVANDFSKLKVDHSFLQRIMANLILNSIQAMPNGGSLTINATRKNGKALITVKDTGEGIPKEVRGKLFMPLMTTKAKGQGFGLAVVKRLTEAMGGTVTFQSETGKGTIFTLEFPQ